MVDTYTIRLYTKELNPLVPRVLHYPATAIFVHRIYDVLITFVEVGLGPMGIESFNEQNGEVVLVKHNDWWGGQQGFDKQIMRGYDNCPTTRPVP